MKTITIPWPDWTIVREIGRGGFGTVYEISRKDQYGSEEKAALKVINIPHEAEVINQYRMDGYDDASISARLKEDAQKINQEYYLQNQLKGYPNIVRVDDNMVTAHSDGLGWDLFIRMELLRPMMEVLLTKQDLSEKEIIKIGTDICEALNVCHRKDIIHRDIKPDNIFLGDAGDWKLGDFGIARTMEHTTKATKAGTFNYLAPEVYHGEKYGKQVDIYSLGMVLYWLLNKRRRPFLPVDRPPTASEDEQARIKRFRGDPLPSPVRGSEELKRIVLKACAYHPKDRYSSPEEMLMDLQAVESGAHHVNASAAAGKDTYDSFAVLESAYEGSGISAGSDVSIGSGSAAGEGVSMGNGWEKDDPGTIGKPHRPVGGKNKNDFLGNIEKTERSVEIDNIAEGIRKSAKTEQASSYSKPYVRQTGKILDTNDKKYTIIKLTYKELSSGKDVRLVLENTKGDTVDFTAHIPPWCYINELLEITYRGSKYLLKVEVSYDEYDKWYWIYAIIAFFGGYIGLSLYFDKVPIWVVIVCIVAAIFLPGVIAIILDNQYNKQAAEHRSLK